MKTRGLEFRAPNSALRIMTDYFERLGLPRRFSVDPDAVEREYLARSRELHPDFHQLAAGAEQRASLELTAALNQAYVTLRDPFRRAEYLLTLLGGPSAQQEKNLDQTFLMDMMDVRERIEQAKAVADPDAALRPIEDDLSEREADFLRRIAAAFDRLDALPADAPPRADHLLAVRRSLNAVKTTRSLLRDLRAD